MFWYLSIINRNNNGQYGGQAQQQQGPVQNSNGGQHEPNGQIQAGQAANGYVQGAGAGQIDTSSAYDGMETSSSSPDSEEGSSSDQWSQTSGSAGGGGMVLRSSRSVLAWSSRTVHQLGPIVDALPRLQ